MSSIAAACVSLLAAITTLSKQLTPFVIATRGARKDVDGFSRELTSLELCVCTLKDEDLAFPEPLKLHLVVVLRYCDHAINDMHRFMGQHQSDGIGKPYSVLSPIAMP